MMEVAINECKGCGGVILPFGDYCQTCVEDFVRVHEALGNRICREVNGWCTGKHRYGCRLCANFFDVEEVDREMVGNKWWPFCSLECADDAAIEGDREGKRVVARMKLQKLAEEEFKNA